MKVLAFLTAALAISGLATPASASGGLLCRTAGARPIDLRLVISHTAVPSVVSARLIDAGREVPVSLAQSWIEPGEVRVDLVDRNAQRHELRLRARERWPFRRQFVARRQAALGPLPRRLTEGHFVRHLRHRRALSRDEKGQISSKARLAHGRKGRP